MGGRNRVDIGRLWSALAAISWALLMVHSGCSTSSTHSLVDPSSSGGQAGASPGSDGGDSGPAGSSGREDADCTAGDRRCDGLTPEHCSETGAWLPSQAACAVSCYEGECRNCAEGEAQCRNGAIQVCSDGSWTTAEVCEKTCEDAECVDLCTEGRSQCNGDTWLQVCVDGVYVDDGECEFLCSDGECSGECMPDAKRCDEDAPDDAQTCDASGQWGDGTTCQIGTFCVLGDCKPCSPGSKRCSQSGPQACSDAGEWVNQGACGNPTPACVDGLCTACAPAEVRCNGTNQLEQCLSDGSGWEVIETCSGDTPACLENTQACGRCDEGSSQCADDSVQTCNDVGAWESAEMCVDATPQCVAGDCAECDPTVGERRCPDSKTAQACDDDGTWGKAEACGGDTPECREDLNFSCGCAEGDRRCANSTVPELCEGGGWTLQAACSGTLDYCLPSTGECVDCVPGAGDCLGTTTAHECGEDGTWQSLNSCSGAGVNCGGCDLGEDCSIDEDCNSLACVNSQCAVCQPGARECVGNAPRECSDQGTWVQASSCSGATPECDSDSGKCVAADNRWDFGIFGVARWGP